MYGTCCTSNFIATSSQQLRNRSLENYEIFYQKPISLVRTSLVCGKFRYCISLLYSIQWMQYLMVVCASETAPGGIIMHGFERDAGVLNKRLIDFLC